MTTDLIQHAFHGQAVRVITDEHGDPWFIAGDVAAILGYRDANSFTRRVDDDDKGTQILRTPGGDQSVTVVTEPGLYIGVLGSTVPRAREFKRWVTHELLPEIRRTGSYTVPQSREQRLALAVIDAQAMLAEKDERIAYLEPRAQVADELLDATGDTSVGDTAKILTRAAVPIGETRLFAALADLGWIYRGGDGRWHVKQSAIESGRMSTLPQTHYHPRTGQVVLDAPQPRVTPKGIAYLLRHLTGGRHLEAAS
ncbi:MAG TPA: phage antirepressor KilAC domain-containing protein [Cellulomonadaceae bacterium]|nr:phage antirepressor KilAC domain-containing protein [Cellulomonadaceae bacterium]